MTPLRDLLIARKDDVVERWKAAVRRAVPETRSLTTPELEDHVPGLVDELIEVLAADDREIPASSPNAAGHGRQRLRVGFDIDAVVREYAILRDCILDVAEEAGVGLTIADFRVLSQAINVGVADAVTEHAGERTRLLELFIGIMSHDLRTPLSAVSTGAEFLLRKRGLPVETVSRVAARIVNSAERMTRLIEQLLDVTRAGLGGGLPVDRRWVDLGPIAEHAGEELESANPGRRVHVEIQGEVSGMFDPDRVAQIITNLAQNGLRHGARDGEVTVRLRADDDEVMVEVHNRGEPIPDTLLPSLFNPFQRGQGAPGTGLGLGLFIAREAAQAHAGSIEVASSAADGTTFRVRLPRQLP